MQKHVNIFDLVKIFLTSIYLQTSPSIQPRTRLSKVWRKFWKLVGEKIQLKFQTPGVRRRHGRARRRAAVRGRRVVAAIPRRRRRFRGVFVVQLLGLVACRIRGSVGAPGSGPRSEVNIELNFPPKLRGARSRLYRRRFLQVNTRWKALAEIYTMPPFSNLNFFVKNRQNVFAIELMNIH